MRKILPIIWRDDFSRQGFGVALIFWLVSLFLLALFWFKLPPQVPLFYSHSWGEEQLAAPILIFLLPGLTLFVFLVNLLIAGQFASEEKLLTRILALTSSLGSFLIFYTLIRILALAI